MIKAIQTRYNGYRFRSRLEARWAVFFDALGIKYEYEKEGFEIKPIWEVEKPKYYLPDFWLPKTQTWAEVKGSADQFDLDLLEWAIDYGGCLPHVADAQGSTRGLLLLGPLPLVNIFAPSHLILRHMKGVYLSSCQFTPDGGLSVGEMGIALNKESLDLYAGFHSGTVKCPRRVYAAYEKARSARFEHGELPS